MPQIRPIRRRQLSAEKLKAARLKAQQFNVAEFARTVGIDRTAYLKWESPERGITHVDYIAMTNILNLLGVSYEEITDPVQDGAA